MEFNSFPIPTRKAVDLPTISTLPDGQYVVAATTEGFRRILKTDVGLARIFVSGSTPTGDRTSQDFWIQPSESPAVMRWWNGTEWQVTTYVPNKANLEALLELGDAATFDTGTNEGDIPILSAGGKLGSGLIPAITNALLATMPANRMKGRLGSEGEVQDLTPTQARQVLELGNAALIDVGNSVGQLPAVQSNGRLASGIIPAPFTAVSVRTINDLPTASGGVITLAPNTTYFVSGTINMVQLVDIRIVASNNSSIIGLDPANTALVYNGSAPFLTASNVNLFIQGIAFVCPNAPVFDWASDGTHTLTTDFVSVITGEVGTFFGGKTLSIFRNNWQGIGDGATVFGEWDKVLLSQSVCETSAGTSSDSIIHFAGSPAGPVAVVSGAGHTNANGTYAPVGELNGKPRYRQGATNYFIEFDFVWRIRFGSTDLYTSSSTVDFPWDVPSWDVSLEGSPPAPEVDEGGAGGTLINDIDIFGNKFVSDTLTAIRVDNPDAVEMDASIVNNRFRGSAEFIDGVDSGTPDWVLLYNTGIPNTPLLTGGIDTIAVSTVIPNVSGFVYSLSAAAITLTFPPLPAAGFEVTVINYSGGSCTIDANGNDIRSGSIVSTGSVTILNDEVLKFIFDGTNWLLTT